MAFPRWTKGVAFLRRKIRRIGPDFFCIGAPKTGTGWLFEQLSQHPDFWMPPVKELHGLDFHQPDPAAAPDYKAASADLDSTNQRRGAQGLRSFTSTDVRFLERYLAFRPESTLDDYADLFRPKGRLISGDITPAYSAIQSPRIAEIAGRFPDAKIIFFARDPVERFWSQYCMDLRLKGQDFTADPERVAQLLKKTWAKRRAFPTQIVRRWRAHYKRDQVHVFFFDDLKTDPASLRWEVLGFLGADPDKPSGSLPVDLNRKLGQTMPMPADIERYLAARFADELVRCRSEFGGPASSWVDRHAI